jgi:hypothetical protein
MYRRLTAKLPLGALLLGIFSVAVTIYLNLTGTPTHPVQHITFFSTTSGCMMLDSPRCNATRPTFSVLIVSAAGSPYGHSHIHQEDIDKQKPDIEDESGTSVYSSTAWWLWFAIVSSDWLIAVAYLCIPLELLYFWCSFG